MHHCTFPDMGILPSSFCSIDFSLIHVSHQIRFLVESTQNFHVVSQKKCIVILTKTGLKQLLITKIWKNERPVSIPLTFVNTVGYHQNTLYEIDVGEKTCLKNCYELKM